MQKKEEGFKSRRKYQKVSDLDKLGRISHKLIKWLESSLSKTLSGIKRGEIDGVEAIAGKKDSLLSTLVVLIDAASKLEKAKRPADEPAPQAQAAPELSDADLMLVRTYLEKNPN